MVGGGHNVRTASGEKIVEVLNQQQPASLGSFRAATAHSLTFDDGILKKAFVFEASAMLGIAASPHAPPNCVKGTLIDGSSVALGSELRDEYSLPFLKL